MKQFIQELNFFIRENFQIIFLSFFAFFIVFVFLTPVLNSGYIADDSLNSLVKGTIDLNHQTIFVQVYGKIVYFLQYSGRFVPIAAFYPVIFYFITNVFLYKLSILLFTILDIILFCFFIFRLTKIKSVFIIVPLLIPIFIQFRNYHDPILGYNLLLQILFFFILSALLLLQNYFYCNKKIYLFLSAVFFELALLTYEIAFCFILLFLLLILTDGEQKSTTDKIKLFLVYIIALFIPLIVILSRQFLFKTVVNSYNGTIFSSEILKCISTFVIQTIGAFPFSYYFFNPGGIFKNQILDNSQYVLIFVLFILYFVFFYYAAIYLLGEILKMRNENRVNYGHLLLWGFALLVLPSFLVSVSQKYQNELVLGWAYLPVFISYFGLLLIVFGLFLYLMQNFKNFRHIKIILLILALTFSGLTVFNYSHNLTVVGYSNMEWFYPRSIIENGIHAGLLNKIPPNSTLIVESYYPWDSTSFYYQNSGISFSNVVGPDRYIWYGGRSKNISDNLPASSLISTDGEKKHFKLNGSTFYSFYASDSQDKGYAIIGTIKDITCSNRQIYEVSANNIRIYIADPLLNYNGAEGHVNYNGAEEYITIFGKWKNSQSEYVPFMLRENQLKIIAGGSGWKIVELPQNTTTDVRSLNVLVSSDYRQEP
jgi:hypothetical protein